MVLEVLLVLAIVQAGENKEEISDSLFLSPGKAVLLSAALPGGGQFYTHQPVKGVILGAGEIIFLTRTFLDVRELSRESDQSRRETLIRNTMGDLFWFLGFWGFSMVDAYVSANLFKFKEKNIEIYTPKGRGGITKVRLGFFLRF